MFYLELIFIVMGHMTVYSLTKYDQIQYKPRELHVLHLKQWLWHNSFFQPCAMFKKDFKMWIQGLILKVLTPSPLTEV